MTIKQSPRRIYVASLSDYNNGQMHGAWLDVDGKDADELQTEVNAILRTSKYPNVQVDCPNCGPHDALDGTCAYLNSECKTCNGTGSVPSAEEFAIHDHEGFGELIGEYTSLEDVIKHASLLNEHGDAWLAYVDSIGVDYATEENFQDCYAGEYQEKEDWAEQYADDTGLLDSVPENLRGYFDMARFARDCEMNGDINFVDHGGTLYAFNNC